MAVDWISPSCQFTDDEKGERFQKISVTVTAGFLQLRWLWTSRRLCQGERDTSHHLYTADEPPGESASCLPHTTAGPTVVVTPHSTSSIRCHGRRTRDAVDYSICVYDIYRSSETRQRFNDPDHGLGSVPRTIDHHRLLIESMAGELRAG